MWITSDVHILRNWFSIWLPLPGTRSVTGYGKLPCSCQVLPGNRYNKSITTARIYTQKVTAYVVYKLKFGDGVNYKNSAWGTIFRSWTWGLSHLHLFYRRKLSRISVNSFTSAEGSTGITGLASSFFCSLDNVRTTIKITKAIMVKSKMLWMNTP